MINKYLIAAIFISGLFSLVVYIIKQHRRLLLEKHRIAERAMDELRRKDAQAKVRYLTIRELREALEPNLTEDQYRSLSVRMSLRSALLAIRKLGLAPATYALNDDYTPFPEGDAVVAFPGKLEPCDQPGSEGWAAEVVLPRGCNEISTWMGIGFDLVGNSSVAAVEPGTMLAGEFPAEWEEEWKKGRPALTLRSHETNQTIKV